MQRRDPVLIAWVAGLALAALAYWVGPQYFLFRVADSFHVALWRISEAIGDLSLMGRDLVRALAIGIYATFVVLALSVIRRGGPGRSAGPRNTWRVSSSGSVPSIGPWGGTSIWEAAPP